MKRIHHFRNSGIKADMTRFFFQRGLRQIWFHKNDFEIALSYSCGLILSPGKPHLKMLQTETGVHAFNLSDFLKADTLGWETGALFSWERQHCSEGGRLVLDEVVFCKEHTSQMETIKVHYSCQKRVLQGQAWMVMIWVKEKQVKVVGFRKITNETHRLELSLELIDEFLAEGIPISGVSGDGLFFKKDFIKALNKRGIELISKPRKDSKWYLGSEPIQLQEYAKNLPIKTFHYYGKEKVYAKAITVASHKHGYCKIIIVRRKRSDPQEKWVYWACTNLNASVRDILRGTQERWKIEVVFRDCSQHLGLKSNQCYSAGSSERHVAMVFLSYNYLSEFKATEGKTIGYWKRKLQEAYKLERTRVSAQYIYGKAS